VPRQIAARAPAARLDGKRSPQASRSTSFAFAPLLAWLEPCEIDEQTAGSTPEEENEMATVSVRYIVDDVDAAIAFYTQQLGFHEDMHPGPAFAMLSRDDLRLVLSAPSGAGGGGQAMPGGTLPKPGGWNRFSLEVTDLEATVAALRGAGASFRNDIVTGVGGKQILVEDPSGNPVELFEPILPEAKLSPRG
jgi:catechol 2,3-dioxygenase-like lactoylglutathione lyase family enzyme